MTKYSLIISLLFIIMTTQSLADESNLENFSYPSHTCGEKIKKPKKPARLATYENVEAYNAAIVEYNIEVANYNKETKFYKTCINQYIKNGNNDINIIRKQLNNALKKARTQ